MRPARKRAQQDKKRKEPQEAQGAQEKCFSCAPCASCGSFPFAGFDAVSGSLPVLRAVLRKTVDNDSGCGLFYRPYKRIHTGGHSDPLAPFCLIRDHSATDGSLGRVAPHNAAGFGIQSEHIAVQIARENKAARGRRDRGYERRRGFILPPHASSIRVDRRQPAPPHFFRIIAAKKVFGIARSGPRGAGLADRETASRDFNRGAPIRGVDEELIKRLKKCGASPLRRFVEARTKTPEIQ